MWHAKRKLFLRPFRASKIFFAQYDVILKIKDGNLSSATWHKQLKNRAEDMILQIFWHVLDQNLISLIEMIDYNEE